MNHLNCALLYALYRDTREAYFAIIQYLISIQISLVELDIYSASIHIHIIYSCNIKLYKNIKLYLFKRK